MPDVPNDLLDFLSRHTTLTLATTGPDGQPHAAALFYAFTSELNFIFLSEPDSRHARHIGEGAAVAVTIHADGQDWRQITGLQLHGVAAPTDEEVDRTLYLARFPFIARTEILTRALKSVRFYKIEPRWIRLIDNRLGFGHTQEWHFDHDSLEKNLQHGDTESTEEENGEI